MGWVLLLVEAGVDGSSRSVDVMAIGCPGDLGDIAALGLTRASSWWLWSNRKSPQPRAGILRSDGRCVAPAEPRARSRITTLVRWVLQAGSSYPVCGRGAGSLCIALWH
jgi:hypothetical protein